MNTSASFKDHIPEVNITKNKIKEGGGGKLKFRCCLFFLFCFKRVRGEKIIKKIK